MARLAAARWPRSTWTTSARCSTIPTSCASRACPSRRRPTTRAQWLDRYEAGRRDGTREAFAALDDDGRFLGLALAVDIDREAREVELGYIVAPAARGRGVAVAMLAELTRWAFAELDALRITLIIDVENGASSRVAERCGYVLEGVMRSTHLKDDVRIDAGIWSRLPSDP